MALTAVDRRIIKAAQDGQAPPVAVPPATEVIPPVVKEAPLVEAAFELKLNPDDFEPALVGAVEGLNKHFASEIAKVRASAGDVEGLRNQVTQLLEETESRNLIALVEQQDTRIEALGPEYEDVLGKGSSFDLPLDGEILKARQALANAQGALQDTFSKDGKKMATELAFQRAVSALHGDKQKQIIRKQLASQVDKRNKQATSRPSARNGESSLSVRDAALKNSKKLYAEWGEPEY